MKRFLVMFGCLSALTLLAGCAFGEAFVTDPDGPTGPQVSPAAELAQGVGSATLDYAGLLALVLTAGKTIGRTFVAMKAKKAKPA